MKAEELIIRIEELMLGHPEDDLEVVVFDDSKRYVDPVATTLHVQGIKKIVIM